MKIEQNTFFANCVNFAKKGLASGDDSARITFELCGGEEELKKTMEYFAHIQRVDTLEITVENETKR